MHLSMNSFLSAAVGMSASLPPNAFAISRASWLILSQVLLHLSCLLSLQAVWRRTRPR